MEKVFVFGHKNPDTDTICSAIAYAELKNKLGVEAEPVRLGDVNGETQFALDTFNIQAPRFVEKVADASGVILVDHNEAQQSADDIREARILEVIDHHRIANFETSDPLYYRAEPVGCTATILHKLYKENGVEIRKEIAGLMLSAIISDSLLFKSPTCTEEDVAAAHALAKIAEVDPESYGLEMLKAGADLRDKSVAQLISLDAKEFQMGESRVEVAQVNAVDPTDVLKLKAEIEVEMGKAITAKNLDLFLFIVTDILKNDSVAIALGRDIKAVEQAFSVVLEQNSAVLAGVVSRKKQVVPVLTETLSKISR